MKIERKGDKIVIVDFNEVEVYKIARKIEKDGIDFYEKLMVSVEDKSVKDKLQFLLQEERKHYDFFSDKLYELKQTKEDAFEEDDILNYMDYEIFKPLRAVLDMPKIIKDISKAVLLGSVVEEKTIVFYRLCLASVSSQDTKKELENIIDEEGVHKKLFEKIAEEII